MLPVNASSQRAPCIAGRLALRSGSCRTVRCASSRPHPRRRDRHDRRAAAAGFLGSSGGRARGRGRQPRPPLLQQPRRTAGGMHRDDVRGPPGRLGGDDREPRSIRESDGLRGGGHARGVRLRDRTGTSTSRSSTSARRRISASWLAGRSRSSAPPPDRIEHRSIPRNEQLRRRQRLQPHIEAQSPRCFGFATRSTEGATRPCVVAVRARDIVDAAQRQAAGEVLSVATTLLPAELARARQVTAPTEADRRIGASTVAVAELRADGSALRAAGRERSTVVVDAAAEAVLCRIQEADGVGRVARTDGDRVRKRLAEVAGRAGRAGVIGTVLPCRTIHRGSTRGAPVVAVGVGAGTTRDEDHQSARVREVAHQ